MNRFMGLAVAAFLTAGITTAYADGEGNGNFGGISPQATVVAGTELPGVTGSDAYPTARNSTAVGVVAGGTLPTNGSEGIVQTANSLPRGFENGTGNSNTAYASAQAPVVAGGVLPPNGSDGIVQTANSLPAGFGDINGNPAIAFAQAHAGHNFEATLTTHARHG
jgi:hypothetical protein